MAPGDRAVLRRVELIGSRGTLTGFPRPLRSEPVRANGLVDVADQATHHGEAGQHREIALRHAERHVDAARVTPLGDDLASAKDQTVGTFARTDGSEHVAEMLGLVGDGDVPAGLRDEVPRTST